jgi:hypothetical protein
MVRARDVTIGIQHGDNCTCHKLEPVCVAPVIVHDDCPGSATQPHRKQPETVGRIAITWPAPRHEYAPLGAWEIQIHNLDADRPILTATGMRIAIGGDGWDSGGIYADLTLLVDDDGEPIPNNGKPAIDEDSKRVRTGVFRYVVGEMRTAVAGKPKV